MHEPGDLHVLVLAAGIVHFLRRTLQLAGSRDDLQAQWVGRIRRVDKAQEMRRDTHGQMPAAVAQGLPFLLREFQDPPQLLRRAKGMPQLPEVVPPLLRRGSPAQRRRQAFQIHVHVRPQHRPNTVVCQLDLQIAIARRVLRRGR